MQNCARVLRGRSQQSGASKLLSLPNSGELSSAILLLNSGDPLHLPHNPAVLFAFILQASALSYSFAVGLQIHSRVLKSGLDSDRFVGNSLLSLYFKLSPTASDTRKVFDALPVRDAVSWASMLSCYVRSGKPADSLRLFASMLHSGLDPNPFALSSMLKACSQMATLRLGQCFHGIILVRGLCSNPVIHSGLTDMYGSNSSIDDARKVFIEMPQPDAVCWTSMISALARNDWLDEALSLFRALLKTSAGLVPDDFLLGTILSVLGNSGMGRQGKETHAKLITAGLSGRVVVESSAVDMYSKCGLVDDARRVFDRMESRNAVSWCALLGGCCQNGDFKVVLDLFRQMDADDDDDQYSFSIVLRACAGLAAPLLGKELHCRFLRVRGGRNDVVVESALVDLYAKCGSVCYAQRVFSAAAAKNLITWNAMVSGFAQNGRAERAMEVFCDMIEAGTRPDYVTFVAVLFACSHAGMVEEGKKHFGSMKEAYGIEAGIEHYSCMVDLLSRAGMLEEAEALVMDSAFRDDSSLWAALLGACATHQSPELAERVGKKMIELQPGYHLSYVLLGNVYKTVGRWDDASKIRTLMRKRGARKKEAGKSWVGAHQCLPSTPLPPW